VPIVTHLHGAHVADISDGYAEEWFLPAAQNIPAGFATTGTWYDFFKPRGEAAYGQTWTPGSAVFQYPNDQRASTLWYHDHTLGMTRLNVYAGPAGFYLIRGGPEDVVTDSATNMPAVLPGPAPGTTVDPFGDYYEIPIAIQDRSFNADGSLFFPDTRAFFDGYPFDFGIDPATAFIPNTPISPIWNPEFFGNMMVVNGQTWPYLNVEKRRYRFRFLNGCNSRFLVLDFSQIPGVQVWQIGAEGGFLPAPVNLTTTNANQVLMGLAERADIIVDFTGVTEGNYILGNVGPDTPFGGFPTTPSDPNTTGQVMQFRVVQSKGTDPSTPPNQLVLPTITPIVAPTIRQVSLNEEMYMSGTFEGPSAALLGTMDMGSPVKKLWMNAITENPQLNTTETWEIYNFTADAHPIHLHLVQFQVVNRQGLVLDAATGAPVTPVVLDGPARGPESWETGFKDTVIAYPGEVTRIKALFDMTGLYVWHCHIVDHEDNEMMRPYFVGDTATDGAPYQTYAESQGKNLFGPDMPMPPMP
jgi:FtsP/CotA-like multicopper oxidase with cupredoxin domain